LNKDTLQIVVSDFHSGSNYALFPDRVWTGDNGNTHAPNSIQIMIRKHFEAFCAVARAKRKNKRVVLVHNGDAIDGDHHQSGDVCTLDDFKQADIHIELMNELQKRIDWQRGDRIYYSRGTKTHVSGREDYIGQQMNAVPSNDGYVHDIVQLNENGVLSWFAHHGPRKGKGPNRGNSLRAWIKNIYYEAIEDGREFPDIVYTGHVHDPDYATYSARLKSFRFKNMHGVILPSWQAKTSYAYMVAPVSVNRIGGVLHEIKADGTICVPEFCVMET